MPNQYFFCGHAGAVILHQKVQACHHFNPGFPTALWARVSSGGKACPVSLRHAQLLHNREIRVFAQTRLLRHGEVAILGNNLFAEG